MSARILRLARRSVVADSPAAIPKEQPTPDETDSKEVSKQRTRKSAEAVDASGVRGSDDAATPKKRRRTTSNDHGPSTSPLDSGLGPNLSALPVATTPDDPILNPHPHPSVQIQIDDTNGAVCTTIRPRLSFRFEDARKHLEGIDARFGVLMDQARCKLFQGSELGEEDGGVAEEVDVFRSLATSILGQQVSWLAARSITYRFIRLFFPDLPETVPKPDPSAFIPTTELPFPSPRQVVTLPLPEGTNRVAYYRSAGLSERKAEYVIELAERFHDGRLKASVLAEAPDDEVLRMLCEVRGIGKWTVQMFEIWSLRRADILPAADLGIQKGLIKWFTTPGRPVLHPKVPPTKKRKTSATKGRPSSPSSTVPATLLSNLPEGERDDAEVGDIMAVPFPPNTLLTPEILKARLNKKLKGNIYLSPQEMEELTEAWRPYRSIGVWYLWALSEGGAQ